MIDLLKKIILSTLDEIECVKGFPGDQPEATAFSMVLTNKLALELSTANSVQMLGAPHSVKTRKKIASLPYKHFEWILDFVMVQEDDRGLEMPLLVCESEVCPRQNPGFWELLSERPKENYYVEDFRKLLFFKSPNLLFVARTQANRINELSESLNKMVARYVSLLRDQKIFIVILPAGRTQIGLSQVGYCGNGGAINFLDLIS